MYKWDDFKPYLYKTNDYGKTWQKIIGGLPDQAFTRVIREDPNKRGLLYAGTETGLYLSFDAGAHWQPMQFNLPVVPITDLVIHKREKDLVAATQGRSFWVFDDLPLIHQMAEAGGLKFPAENKLFQPEDTYRTQGGGGTPLPATATVGKNPPNGVVVYYSLKNKPGSEVVLEFFDASGKSIRKFTAAPRSASAEGSDLPPPPTEGSFGGQGTARITTDAGLNRFVWDLRYADAVRFPGMILWAGEMRGPRVAPGSYQVKLTVEGKTTTQTFVVKPDPRLSTSAADYARQLDLALKIRDKLSDTHHAIIKIREVRKQIEDLLKRVKEQPNFNVINDAGTALKKNLTTIEETLYQTKNQSNQDPLNFPIRLNNKLAALAGVVSRGESAPTEQSFAVYEDLTGQIDPQLQRLQQIFRTDVPAFNELVRNQGVPAVVVRQ
jgi:hypothetical protein